MKLVVFIYDVLKFSTYFCANFLNRCASLPPNYRTNALSLKIVVIRRQDCSNEQVHTVHLRTQYKMSQPIFDESQQEPGLNGNSSLIDSNSHSNNSQRQIEDITIRDSTPINSTTNDSTPINSTPINSTTNDSTPNAGSSGAVVCNDGIEENISQLSIADSQNRKNFAVLGGQTAFRFIKGNRGSLVLHTITENQLYRRDKLLKCGITSYRCSVNKCCARVYVAQSGQCHFPVNYKCHTHDERSQQIVDLQILNAIKAKCAAPKASITSSHMSGVREIFDTHVAV